MIAILLSVITLGPPPPEPPPVPVDLSAVRTVAVVKAEQDSRHDEVRTALAEQLPYLVQVPRDRAELLIEYTASLVAAESTSPRRRLDGAEFVEELLPPDYEGPSSRFEFSDESLDIDATPSPILFDPEKVPTQTRWRATFYRYDCQSAEFGEKPVPAVDGYCENRVYVRVLVGRMSGTVEDGESALDAFLEAMREATIPRAANPSAPAAAAAPDGTSRN